ncbi:MAG: efflux RND transporter permease subunit, partial [Polaromonas sp.]|nr:efflux RND transporter permease subunit [Polaromonas sp.]
VGFTVLSISLSLVAVFIPLLFMGGQTGRLFREFAVTLSAAVLISLVISLTTTPMMCAWLLKPAGHSKPPGRLARGFENVFNRLLRGYEVSLDWALAHRKTVMAMLLAVIVLNVYLYVKVPKGYFPQQDSGQIRGGLRADRSISFEALQGKLREVVDIIERDPAVDTVVGFTGGSRSGGGFMFINLKPVAQRTDAGQAVIARLRPQLAQVTGVTLFLNPVQDLRGGGRQSNSTYQYTLKSDNAADLSRWATRLADQMKRQPALADVDTDQEENGVETMVTVDKASAARLGISSRDVNNALYNAFGQRPVGTIYTELNQYRVIMEVAPRFTRSPESLKDIYIPVKGGSGTAAGAAITMVPLSAIAQFSERTTAASVSHEDGELSTTVSYNLAEGSTLSDAEAAVLQAEADIGLPSNVRGSFAATARSAQESQNQQPLLILAALVVIYIVLG